MSRVHGLLSTWGIGVALLTIASSVHAGPVAADPQCGIGAAVASASAIYVDANGNGVWDGQSSGDWSAGINVQSGPGALFTGDWNGDGFDDIGKLGSSGAFSVDLNGNHLWEGNAGGDRVTSYAVSYFPGDPVVGDWNGNGRDEIGLHSYSDHRWLRLDRNGDGLWPDGTVLFHQGEFQQPPVRVIGDWNDNGVTDTGYFTVRTAAQWPPSRMGPNFWLGIHATLPYRYFVFARFVVGSSTPLIGDWDGDGDDDLGVVVGNRYYIDLNGNLAWDGIAGGDRSTVFAVGGDAAKPIAGRWSPD